MTRLGALRLEGTEGTQVSGCSFERLDGQALMLDGYNRQVLTALVASSPIQLHDGFTPLPPLPDFTYRIIIIIIIVAVVVVVVVVVVIVLTR